MMELQLIDVILFIALFPLHSYISLIVHECGHYLGAIFMKAESKKIVASLSEKKFYVRFNFGRKPTRTEDIIISIAGPMAQLLLILIFIMQPYLIALKLVAIAYLPMVFRHLIPSKGSDGQFIQNVLPNQQQVIYKKLSYTLYSFVFLFSILYFQLTIVNNPEYTMWTIALLTILALPFWWKLLRPYYAKVVRV
ncbi:hypothetical protein [Alkalihalobacillus pseudalcaliphilus]|uniref:hypothetical protein n=1 Tax=Alkalihalobacillus pseudalcaliphilus TaxID=79884 RepID=UPI00064D9055|nr:hypothetical protein [Alkalihalobacillus pseudalcaliphilus]KMK76748.1 hypothetical protein AB990_07480 [Alkalihalobacillus pseudalcaliphilus]